MRENKNQPIQISKIWKGIKHYKGLNVDIGRIQKPQKFAVFKLSLTATELEQIL